MRHAELCAFDVFCNGEELVPGQIVADCYAFFLPRAEWLAEEFPDEASDIETVRESDGYVARGRDAGSVD